MKITSIERFILETLENGKKTFNQIHFESGLQENVCFNTLQALVIKNIVHTNGLQYYINRNLDNKAVEEINLPRFKREESVELIENYLNHSTENFMISKVAFSEQDYKIFKAMLKNIDSFISDCHKKMKNEIPYKDRIFIFWGMTKTSNIINQMAA